ILPIYTTKFWIIFSCLGNIIHNYNGGVKMRHFYGIIAKLLWTTFVLISILTIIYHYNFWSILGLSSLIVSFSFVIGDIYLLRTTNNFVALISDFILITLLIVFAGSLATSTTIPYSIALVSSLIIVIGEWPLHRYLIKHADEIPELQ